MSLRRSLAVAALLLASCGAPSVTPDAVDAGDPLENILPPPPEEQGFQLRMDAVAKAGQETWLCDVYEMPNLGFANINRVEVRQNENTHHLTLSTLGLTNVPGLAFGRYDCKDLYGDRSLMEKQIMFYGNQGSAEHVMRLPAGVAAQFPPKLTVIHEMHYVNATTSDVRLYSRINGWTIPPKEVTSGIWGGSVRDENIHIPPRSTHEEWSRCVMNRDVEILFLASHMHSRGKEFTIRPFDGKNVGDVIYRNDDWHIPLITQYEKPIVLKKGAGFEWKCKWKNDDGAMVQYGNAAADEMCNLAIVHTPFDVTAACEVVETSDGVLWKPKTMQ